MKLLHDLPNPETIKRFTISIAEPVKQEKQDVWITKKKLQRRAFQSQGLTVHGKPRKRPPDLYGVGRQMRCEGYVVGSPEYRREYVRRVTAAWRKTNKQKDTL